MPLFSLKNLCYSYGKRNALKNVSLDIDEGQLVVIVGENGTGKSTLLKIIAGLLIPTSGSMIQNNSETIGYVAQDGLERQFPLPISVAEFINSSKQIKNIANRKSCSYTTVDECLSHVGLLELRNNLIDELSGGQKQRALIARTLLSNPKVLLLDEPTAGVDTAMQEQFYSLIEHLNTVHGITTIMITHDAKKQHEFGDHLIYLSERSDGEDEISVRNTFQQKKITFIKKP